MKNEAFFEINKGNYSVTKYSNHKPSKYALTPASNLKYNSIKWHHFQSQKVGADLLTHKSDQFLVVRDYYSRYIDIAYLPEQNSKTVIAKMKNIFAHKKFLLGTQYVDELSGILSQTIFELMLC